MTLLLDKMNVALKILFLNVVKRHRVNPVINDVEFSHICGKINVNIVNCCQLFVTLLLFLCINDIFDNTLKHFAKW